MFRIKPLNRFQCLSKTSKYYCPNVITRFSHAYRFFLGRVLPAENLPGIPAAEKLYIEYCRMQLERKNALKLVFKELIKECNISETPLTYSEQKQIIKLSINTLAENNVVPSLKAVVDGLLSHLEPFPFDDREISINESALSIKNIRDIIEKQYLAWKFETSIQNINTIFHKLGESFSPFQSMTNLRRNIDIVENLPLMYQINNVAEKIYHINQIPINVSLLIHFQENPVGLNWHLFLNHCRRLMQKPYQYIVFVIMILKRMQFTDTQIREALPFLNLPFHIFLSKLNFILTFEEIAKHRNEDKFLMLLAYKVPRLKYTFTMQKNCFLEVVNFLQLRRETSGTCNRWKSILYYTSQFYAVDSNSKETLKRHPGWKFVSESQIIDTLNFLKSNGFDESEVTESITIIFYPSKLIESALEKIKEDERSLRKYGFSEGCVPHSTHFFRAGTKSRKKLLQLCLYYLEKHFSSFDKGISNLETGSVAIDDTAVS